MKKLRAFHPGPGKLGLLAVPCALLIGCPAGEDLATVSTPGVSPMNCCVDFARVLADHEDAVALDIRVVAEPDVLSHITNLVQPPGSKFLTSYRCRFVFERDGGNRERVSVGLYLVETRDFAEHTQWEDLQIIPIMRVTDSESGTAGYGVFKYLRRREA